MADCLGMLQELLDDESGALTAWEMEFLDSLEAQRIRNFDPRAKTIDPAWEPTGKQQVVLERIWQKVFN